MLFTLFTIKMCLIEIALEQRETQVIQQRHLSHSFLVIALFLTNSLKINA